MNDETREEELTPEELVKALQLDVDEWRELAHRRSAEIANMQRRSQQEREALRIYASEHMITKMLPVLDDLYAAVEAARMSEDIAGLNSGLELIYTKTVRIFEESGVHIIEADTGEPFNVDFHEALMHKHSDQPEGLVLQNIQRGYRLYEKVIRHAKVITSAGIAPHTDTLEN